MNVKTILLITALFLLASAAKAEFMHVEIATVPIATLTTNLEAKLKNSKATADRARLEWQIGRLHSMAYALGTEEADSTKDYHTRDSFEYVPWYGP